jgi:hypothetical protein
VEIRPMLKGAATNHSAPSEPAAMPPGPLSAPGKGYSVIVGGDCAKAKLADSIARHNARRLEDWMFTIPLIVAVPSN